MVRSIDATAAGLGGDGERLEAAVRRARRRASTRLGEDIMRPFLHVPRHPLRLARFGIPAAAPGDGPGPLLLDRRAARALFGGVAAHAFSPLSRPLSSSVGMALICACHHYGWPVARGGSGAIAAALAAVVTERGGRIETGREVRSLSELPTTDAVVLDLSPSGVAALAGERLPARVARAYRALPPRARRRSRSTSRSRAGCHGRRRRRSGRAPCTRPARSRRPWSPSARSTAAGCLSVRSCWSASSTSPTRRGRAATCIPSGPTPTSRAATTATRPRR